ncbi:hypothetical protein Poli38472_004453 [Pythium oligandrum]|uniref:Uncharacterized protein n=1 Tax=Pythium oligandrum TaxID=41045 RepID=A0A8K1FFW4_PYTOL|nr:hypothetical protein Poli38472_004453 [Pythium oligandrum]|eukprot:TMW59384.1 hypothetical protein Poli38472_004453 [Pythium oligandrum]
MQMAMAKRFLRERTRFLDMTEPLESTEVIPSTYCKDNTTVRFFVEPLVAIRATMDQVYKIVQEWIADVEKQSAGDPILYHVNETLSETVSQRRLIRTAGDHNKEPLVVESNTVTYSEYDRENEVGLLVSRFVDRDDLRPYRPNERLRRDVTSLMMVSQETPLNTEDPPVIVITGWFSTRQRRGLVAMSRDDDVQLLSNHMNAWCDAKLRYLRDTLRHL